MRRTGLGQIDPVDRSVPETYFLLPRSGPPRSARARAGPPPVRGDVMRRLRCIIAALAAMLWIAPLSAQQPTGTIRGRVTDAATQQPLATASVTVGSRTVLTQADGRFVLAGIPAGTDIMRARMLGYGATRQAVTVVAG